MALAPVIYGASTRPPRGDYSEAHDDYTCDQHWERYTPEEHALYARLFARQFKQARGQASDEFVDSLVRLGSANQIPRFDAISKTLARATGWEVVAVPGLIPENAFFALLANRRFPVTVWLRAPEEFDYIVEPDVFHDLYGHVPLLFNPVFADYMQAFGRGGLKAEGLRALEYLARLYWYTVEFGLIKSANRLRVYGAGILSSVGEIQYALTSTKPQRIGFDLKRVLRTPYKIDDYQSTYFVVNSFDQLFDATAPDFSPLYAEIADQPTLPLDAMVPGEKSYSPNPNGPGLTI